MGICYVLVIAWFTLQTTSGEEETSEKYFNTTNHERIVDNERIEHSRVTIEKSSNTTALPRLKREPPFTIIKHKTILIKDSPNPRSRYRFPKPLYSPLSYKIPEPITLYKPQSNTLPLHPKIIFEKPKHINFGTPIKHSSFYEPPIRQFGKPEYVIVENGADKINSDFVYLPDEKNKGKLGYVFPDRGIGKEINTQYIFYDEPRGSKGFPIYSKGHQIYGPILSTTIQPFTSKPYSSYYPKTPFKIFDTKPLYDDDDDGSSTGNKNVHLNYASEYQINSVPPATQFEVPKGLPESFKSGFIGPSYLPPRDFHEKPKELNYKNNSNRDVKDHPETKIQFIAKEEFDNSQLPLEDTKKHPNFDYQKTSYEVPIYEPVPFDSFTSSQEVFPPNLADIFNEEHFPTIAKGSTKIELTLPKIIMNDDSNEQKDDQNNQEISDKEQSDQFSTLVNNLHSLSASLDTVSEVPEALAHEQITTSTRKPRKKKRRTRVPNIKRHIIDISTLKKALIESEQNFESTTPVFQYDEPVQNELSSLVNDATTNFVLLTSTNKPKDSYEWPYWESSKIIKSKEKSEPKDIQLISVQKSKSHSYYDGTMSPDTVQQLSFTTQRGTEKSKEVRFPRREQITDTRQLHRNHRY